MNMSCERSNLGLLIMRVGIGVLFIIHGYPKIMAGSEQWLWLGQQMSHVGITFYPVFWGFLAAVTEFFGGILFTLGLATRFCAFFMAFVMFIATMMHYMTGDPFTMYSNPLALLIVFVGFIFAGGGRYSIDCMIS